MKIDHRKNYLLLVDVETCGELTAPLTYDIGYLICDSKGNIYERRHYVVYEIYCGEKELMKSAYYANKLPMYEERLVSGDMIMKRFFNIRREMLGLISLYKPTAICGYNVGFDRRALNNTMQYLLGDDGRKAYYFPYGVEFWDIWHMACQTLLCRKTYDALAYENQWVSEKGNVRTSAEKAYAYLNGVADFEEKHMGLDDCKIEMDILLKCLKLRVKDRSIVGFPWRIPQPPYKEYVATREGL